MKKRVAVIGYGGQGGWHTREILKSDVVELAGIFDTDEKKQELARKNGIRAYASREELLSDPTVDIVTVATPNDVHEEICCDALNHGKHVISEKPVTLSMDSLEREIACANKNGKLFSVHQNRRFDVDFLAMKQIHDSGEIGEVINIESRIHGSRGIPSDWRGEKEYGGGMLYDWGIHLVDQVFNVLGWDVKTVNCRCDHITNQEVDDGFQLDITFQSGARAYVEVGTYNFIAMPRFYMRGRKGTALIPDWREETQVTLCTAWHESDVLPVQTAAGITKTMAPRDEITTKSYKVARPASDVHDYYRNFVASIDGKATQMVTHEQMRIDLKVILAALDSAEKGGITIQF